MKKKGFTLVELLAVIAILAILVVIVLPNVMYLFNKAKRQSFETETKEVYKLAQQKWMTESMLATEDKHYARTSSGDCLDALDMTGRNEFEYYIRIDKSGNIIKLYTYDGTYQYMYDGPGLKIEDIQDAIQISKMDPPKEVKITCNNAKLASNPPANPGDYMMAGFTGGDTTNYLRTNIQKQNIEKITIVMSLEGHTANGTDCWDVSVGETGAVLLWSTDADNNGLYELTIGSNGIIFLSSGANLFYYLSNLKTIEGMQYLDTSLVTTMENMFYYNPSLTTVDVSNFDTSNVTNMSQMFMGCSSLAPLDVSNFDTSKVTNMASMFQQCSNLEELKINNFNTSNVTTMFRMFSNCSKLTSLDLSSFDTSKVTNMHGMFNSCTKLTSLNLSSFNTSEVTTMSNMFMGCSEFTSLDLSSFNTSKVRDMSNMLANCTNLVSVNLSSFNTPNLTNIGQMFVYCPNLISVDLSSFTTSNMASLRLTFFGCKNLATIYVSSDFNVTDSVDSTNIFYNCPKLVGGAGTTWSSSHIEGDYAHIDGGTSNPGYFTLKQ